MPDLHGNVAAIANAAGSSLTDAFRYDAYGLTIGSLTSTLPTPWRYQGRLLESTAANKDLYDFGARSYAPDLGVFTQLDTSAGSALNPLSMNRFLYANANPATLIDPDGHMTAQACPDGYCSTGNGHTNTVSIASAAALNGGATSTAPATSTNSVGGASSINNPNPNTSKKATVPKGSSSSSTGSTNAGGSSGGPDDRGSGGGSSGGSSGPTAGTGLYSPPPLPATPTNKVIVGGALQKAMIDVANAYRNYLDALARNQAPTPNNKVLVGAGRAGGVWTTVSGKNADGDFVGSLVGGFLQDAGNLAQTVACAGQITCMSNMMGSMAIGTGKAVIGAGQTFVNDPGGSVYGIPGTVAGAARSEIGDLTAGGSRGGAAWGHLTFSVTIGLATTKGLGALGAGGDALAAESEEAGLIGDGAGAATRYVRPAGATTPAQRAAVQGQSCVSCGQTTETQVADHIEPLVWQHYVNGGIDLERMRSIDAVQAMCPTCSAREGGYLSWWARMMGPQ